MVHIADMWVGMPMWVFFTSLWAGGLGITCLDGTGASVDWYAMYKIPKITNSTSSIIIGGRGALYLDVNSPTWTFLNHDMTDTQQAVYQTLSQIYKGKNDDMMYIMYNDEPPKSQISPLGKEDGHTKGVVAFDKGSESGFWLIHSLPQFPPKKANRYAFPGNAYTNGQSLLCVSFPYNQLGNVAIQLWYNEPNIYDKAVPDSYIQDFPVLNDVIQGHTPPGPPYSSVLQMTSLGGQEFTSFAKSGKFEADLYDALVAPSLKQNLLVETWTNGAGKKLESNCSVTYKVMNITYISLAAANVTFLSTKDHSKWAISTPAGVGGEKGCLVSRPAGSGGETACPVSSHAGSGGEEACPVSSPAGSGGEEACPVSSPAGSGGEEACPVSSPAGSGGEEACPVSSPAGSGGEKVPKFHQFEKWTCIGDINRMESQFKRGGGTMCLQNPSVWQAYIDTVANCLRC